MKINYTNKTGDFARLMAAYMTYSMRAKLLILGVAALALMYPLIMTYYLEDVISWPMYFLIISPVVLILVLLRFPFVYTLEIYRDQLFGVRKCPVGEHEVELTADGICDTAPTREQKFMWGGFRCYIITGDFAFIYIDGRHGLAIPRTAINEMDFEQLRTLLRDNLKCEHERV